MLAGVFKINNGGYWDKFFEWKANLQSLEMR